MKILQSDVYKDLINMPKVQYFILNHNRCNRTQSFFINTNSEGFTSSEALTNYLRL
jgi:hypothetical protein